MAGPFFFHKKEREMRMVFLLSVILSASVAMAAAPLAKTPAADANKAAVAPTQASPPTVVTSPAASLAASPHVRHPVLRGAGVVLKAAAIPKCHRERHLQRVR